MRVENMITGSAKALSALSKRQIAFILLVLAMTGVQLSLGFWQWDRRAEKQALLQGIERGAAAAPKSFGEHAIWDRVSVQGRYLPQKTAYIRTSRPQPKLGEAVQNGQAAASGFGVLVISAFEIDPCLACTPQIVLVNRGFVPTPPNGLIPAFETPEGPLSVTGFWRPSEREGLFPPKNDPGQGVFFFRSIGAIAGYLGLPSSTTITGFLDREADVHESQPPFGIRPAAFIKAIPNNHLEYAFTWWALAATNLVIGAFMIRSGGIQRAAKSKSIP
jgi:surfeit locus 1 family protein